MATKVWEYDFLTEPEANDEVVMVTGSATTIEYDRVPTRDSESCTWTTNDHVPAVVGVPDRTPFRNWRPVGNDPDETDQVSGSVPPVAVNVVELIALPVVATGKVVVVTVGGGSSTVSDRVWTLLDPRESLNSTENVEDPDDAGVPLRSPVDERVMPLGRVPVANFHV